MSETELGFGCALDGGDQFQVTQHLQVSVELPILRANVLVRAVPVPAGSHVVTFRYETPLLRAGAMASLAGVVVCLGIILAARARSGGFGLSRSFG